MNSSTHAKVVRIEEAACIGFSASQGKAHVGRGGRGKVRRGEGGSKGVRRRRAGVEKTPSNVRCVQDYEH